MKYHILPLLLFIASVSAAQDSSDKKSLTISGYADFYYQYDLNNPSSKDRPGFLYNFKRHNEFNVNLAFLKAAYNEKRLRANLAFMTGTYPQYNLAAESSLMQHVFEANIGYAFSDKWSMDAGILPSHIGLETAISKDNWNLGRSILAENTPYYESGVKLNYIPNDKWSASVLVLNGWQNIKENNSRKAIGTQVQFKPNDKLLFNSSTFVGNEKPDSVKQTRLFHNFYAVYSSSKKINLAVLLDAGVENKKGWYGAALLLQYLCGQKISTAFRLEYYSDKKEALISANQPGGFQTTGLALNLDYTPVKNISFRAEARYLHSANAIFEKDGLAKKNNFSLLGIVAVVF